MTDGYRQAEGKRGRRSSATPTIHAAVTLEVEEALGSGLDVVVEHGVARATNARRGSLWLGLDRAHVIETDAGDGASLAAVVALPASSFPGCRIRAEVVGALKDGHRSVLATRLHGAPMPPEPLIRTVAQVRGDASWIDAGAALQLAREAHTRYRARRAASRIVDGRAWQPGEGLDPGTRRFTTPHSQAEYRLDRLPPRFVRGLEGLLDDDERILYAIERPPGESGLLKRVRGARDARAALLVLTDRQLLWLIDHMPPTRYLLDWGVDAWLVALEALREVELERVAPGGVQIRVRTGGGWSRFVLPSELRAEALVMVALLRQWVGSGDNRLPRRQYAMEPLDFDPEPASRFGQTEEAVALLGSLEAELHPDPVLGSFYAPRREHVPEAWAAVFTASRLLFAAAPAPHRRQPRAGQRKVLRLDIPELRYIALSLSPLVCRLELETSEPLGRQGGSAAITYPAPLAPRATPVFRLLRRAWANATPAAATTAETVFSAARRAAP